MMVLNIIYLLSTWNAIENFFLIVAYFVILPIALVIYFVSKQDEKEKEKKRLEEEQERQELLRKQRLEAERKEKERKEQEEKERLEREEQERIREEQVKKNREKQIREAAALKKIKEEERLAKEKAEQERIKKKQEIKKQLEEKCRKKALYILNDCSYEERREQIYKAVVTKIALERAYELLCLTRTLVRLNGSDIIWDNLSNKEGIEPANYAYYGGLGTFTNSLLTKGYRWNGNEYIKNDLTTYSFREFKEFREKSIQKDLDIKIQKIKSEVKHLMACRGQNRENAIIELLMSKEDALTRYNKQLIRVKIRIDNLQRGSNVDNNPIYPPLQEHLKTLKLDLPQDKIEDYLFQELVNLIKEQSEQEKIAKEQEHQRELEEQERKRKLEQERLERERQEKIRRENERIERERRERERLEQIEREKRQRELARQNEINYLRNSVSNWYTHRWNGSVKHKWYCDYYSYRDHKDSATSEMWDTWHFIWWFKNDPTATVPTTPTQYQQSLDKAVRLVENTLKETFGYGYLGKLTLVCCTASTLEKNERRFKSFAERVCNDLDMYNAYSHITITEDGNAKHEGGTGLTTKSYDSWWFKDKYIVLFDDVRTSGASLEREKAKLESFGAIVICAITLGQTTN